MLSYGKDCHDHEGYTNTHTHRILENTCIKFNNLRWGGIINEHVQTKQVPNTLLDVPIKEDAERTRISDRSA